jgi:hypothetical protein
MASPNFYARISLTEETKMEESRHVLFFSYDGKVKDYVRHDALVIDSRGQDQHDRPILTVVFFKHDDPASHHAIQGVDYADCLERALDVPHREDRVNQSFYWTEPEVPKAAPDPQVAKLKAFLFENFKNETGDETPVDCAIRLLSKKKK